MSPLDLLATLRTIAHNTTVHCDRNEYKPEVVYKMHNENLANIQNRINADRSLNTKQKIKFNLEIKKLMLAPTKNKAYHSIKAEVQSGVNRLTSAIDFMKR